MSDRTSEQVGEHAGDRRTRQGPVRVVAVLLGLLVVVGLVVVVVATRQPPSRDPGSPEGVVQTYLEAVSHGDNDKAAGYLAQGSGCDAADLDRAGSIGQLRVDLLGTSVTGDTALVRISVTRTDGGPFADTTGEEHVLRLRRTGPDWRLTGLPWPLFDCTGSTP